MFFKMQWLAACVFAASVYGGSGVTKPSGIEQFWTDDFKIFEQVYGKTSDKDLYGSTLPPNIVYGSDLRNTQASEKKERYFNFQQNTDDYESNDFGEQFNELLTKPAKDKPSFKFIAYNDFKPISQDSDPETYAYLKQLEKMEKEKINKYPIGFGGFKPYLNTVGPNPEDTEAYKSIQDILDAHEANKGDDDDEQSKYLTYREKGKKKQERESDSKPARNSFKPRCLPGRCRKRPTNYSYRFRSSRPYIRRIKKVIY